MIVRLNKEHLLNLKSNAKSCKIKIRKSSPLSWFNYALVKLGQEPKPAN